MCRWKKIVDTRPVIEVATRGPEPPVWDSFRDGLEIPCSRREVIEVFGDLKATYSPGGKVKVSRAWERDNMFLARGLPIVPKGKLYVHRKAEPRLREALRRAAISAPDWHPAKVGCFNPRHQRHDLSRPLSYHSWGIAVDFSDAEGKFHRVDAGIPEEVVKAFKSCGWGWGGDWKWKDEMHFELIRQHALLTTTSPRS